MVPPLYCRWRDCGQPHYRIAGMMPPFCPHCAKPAMWTTNVNLAGRFVEPVKLGPAADFPSVPYALSYMDKRFLRSLRIEWREDADGGF